MAVFSYSLGNAVPDACLDGAITIGNFDGVHRGHQALLAETIRLARQVGGPAVAVTFDPPPWKVLRPESFQPLLTPLPYRCELLQARSADHVVVLQTTVELLHLEADDFFTHILHEGFRARAVVEGYNFGFGRDRAGDAGLLIQLGPQAGITVMLLEAQQFEGRPVSSSRVRADLAAGQVAHAHAMLGR